MQRQGKKRKRRSGGQRGFTLIEIMVVLVILAMIAGLVFQNVFTKVDEAKIKTTRTQISILGLALDNYRLDVGSYPASLQELVESSAKGWKGPYLRGNKLPQDAWGNDFTYEVVGEGNDYHISSSGGGKEPINSWE